jgi:hypothetical protein
LFAGFSGTRICNPRLRPKIAEASIIVAWELPQAELREHLRRSDGVVLKVLENLINEVNDRLVGNPKRSFDEYSSKFFLSYETKIINLVGKSQTTEGDAC